MEIFSVYRRFIFVIKHKKSTIEKLSKLKDKVAKDSGDKLQDKLGDKKKDREI